MSGSELNLDSELGDTGEESPLSLTFLAPAVGPDEIGRLAHYRVLKVLGQGGMGIVFLAEDTHLQRPVALKVIRPEFGQSLSNRQRFLREARGRWLKCGGPITSSPFTRSGSPMKCVT